MPLSNPFRRSVERPSLGERAAALRASFRPTAPVTAPAPATSPAPGSAEAIAAFHEACRQHSARAAHLHDCPELMRDGRDVWSTQSLMQALEVGEIGADEYARLHPIASERELRFAEITHELKIGALFALAYASEYPEPPTPKGSDDRVRRELRLAPLAAAVRGEPTHATDLLDRDLSREAFDYAHGLSLTAVPFGNLIRLYEVFGRTADLLADAREEDQFWTVANSGVQTAGGTLIDAEQNRLGCLRDVCAMELAKRTPASDAERDAALVLRLRHELLCEMKIRDTTLLAEIREVWAAE